MREIKKFLIVGFLTLLLIISGCGNTSDEVKNDQVEENEIEEVMDQDDENESKINEEEIENDEREAADIDKEDSVAKAESNPTETKKEKPVSTDSSTKESSSIKKSESKKSPKTSSPTKKKESKPKKSTNNPSTSKTKKPPKKKAPKEEKIEQTVTVVISIPSGLEGNGLAPTTVTINEGDTVLDASLKTSAQINYSGSGATAYIKGINGLNEFDEGPMSGWQVKVDGSIINRSAGNFEVKPNQKIEWVYTTDYSK